MGITERAARELERDRAVATKFDDEPAQLWKRLLRKRGERFVGDEANVLQALRSCPELAGLVQFNEFRTRVELSRQPPWRACSAGDPWTDQDDFDLQAYLQRHEIEVRQRGTVGGAVERVSRDKTVHPVRDYLDRLEHDGTARLDTWLSAYLRAEGPASYLAATGRKFLVQAVARAMRPGCQADATLTLVGDQGVGKSSAARILGREWASESAPHDLGSKDAMLSLQGAWFIELPELAALHKSQLETWKAFLTRRVDRFRPPFGRRDVEVPRSCVFVATTNVDAFLRDPTGNRRFWPVRCGHVDRSGLEQVVDQLWAEAVVAYRAGESWHLVGEEESLARQEQQLHELVTELEQKVADFLDWLESTGKLEVDTRRVLTGALHLEDDAADYAERAGRLGPQVVDAMKRAGWHRVKPQGRGPNRRVIYRKVGSSQGVIG